MVQGQEEINRINSKIFIEYFEKKSLEKRINLLENISWKSDDEICLFMLDKVKEFTPTSNEWYNVLMIESVEELKFVDNQILIKLLQLLRESNHYMIKLSVLDVLMNPKFRELDSSTIRSTLREIVLNKSERLIVRVQGILILKYFDWDENVWDDLLLKHVSQSNDHRLHIRLYEFLLDVGNVLDQSVLSRLIRISSKKDLGKALEKTLTRIIDCIPLNEDYQKSNVRRRF